MTLWEKIGLALALLFAVAAVFVWRRGGPAAVVASSGPAPDIGGYGPPAGYHCAGCK